jgi:NAD(P)-dependent dehydrogenase (short-subunit alcohol dehydrogenase family)
MTHPFDYTGKHVFVAGGSSGINLGIAESFARRGANIGVCARKQEKLDGAVLRLKALGIRAEGWACDVRDFAKTSDALAGAAARFGPIDVLVSGAAGNFPAPAVGISSNGFKAVMDIDVLGTFHVLRAGFDHLRKPGAAVINITAPQSTLPTALQAHVCAAKAGVDMLTKTLALEWAAAGVRVNAISPGPIDDTEGMRRLAPSQAARAAVEQALPLRRFGTASEIGDAALFLASPMAGYITGVVVPVDGGWQLVGSGIMAAALGAQ